MLNYILPILLIITSNVFYNICTKSTPKNVNPFASLCITYAIATGFTFLLLFFNNNLSKETFSEFKHINWTSFLLGILIVGLEYGYIQAYRAGWDVSVCSLVANISLAIMLIFVGILLYKEQISINQIIGILICIIGLVFINKK